MSDEPTQSDETPDEAGEETPVEAGEETPVGAGEETPVDAAEETPAEVGEETPVEAAEETPVDAAEQTPVEAGQGAPVEVVGGTPAEAGAGTPVEAGAGTPVEVVPLEVAEAVVEGQHRRRRLVLYAAVPTLVLGLVFALTQVKLGGGSQAKPPAVRDWESGMRLIEAGKSSKGLALLEEVVASLPEGTERARGHVRLAEVYRTLGQDESYYLNSAVRHYTTALDSVGHAPWPKDVAPVDEVLYKTGQCFAALGSHETAVQFFEELDAEFPSSPFRPDARLEVGKCYLAAGRYERARQVLAEVAEAYRGDPLGEEAFFRFAASFDQQARSLRAEE